MKFKLNSFRSKIVLALVVSVTTITILSFYFYNKSLKDIVKTEHDKNVISVLNILKEQFYHTLGSNEGKIIYTLLDFTRLNKNVKNAYLLNSDNELIYPTPLNLRLLDSLNLDKLAKTDSSIFLETKNSGSAYFTRAYIPLQNSSQCYSCHPRSTKYLGTIVVDILGESPNISVGFTKKFIIVFAIIILIIIGLTIMVMHFRFVKRALREFQNTIEAVNLGVFHKRLSIPETKELGQLGRNFNTMLDNFQKTQKELEVFHKNQMRNNYKLATVGEMSARLAHEIRNPITGIANAIEIISSEIEDEKSKAILDEVLRQANRVNQAITDLLKYSRQKEIVLKESDINDLIRGLLFFLENQSPDKRIILKKELQENIPTFDFDRAQLEDVFLNLGINAIQSINKKGTIVFKTSYNEENNMVRISIKDSGKGIPEDVKSQIFHPFFTTRNEGTGLGLAIVKDIIDKHKGEIWVENNTGAGCTFIVELPVKEDNKPLKPEL